MARLKCNPFGQCHDVWFNALAFRSNHPAGAAKPGLDFIDNQQDSVLITDFAKFGKMLPMPRANAFCFRCCQPELFIALNTRLPACE